MMLQACARLPVQSSASTAKHSRQAAIPQRCIAAMCLQLPGTRDEGL